MLEAIRRRLPNDFGHLPSVFALDGTQQPAEIRPHSATGFVAGKAWHDATFDFGQPYGPGTHRLQGHVCWGWAQLLTQLHGSFLHNVSGTMITYDLQL